MSKLVGNWPLPGTRVTPNTYLLVASSMNARLAIQFGLSHFLEICRVCYRVFIASAPMRLSRPGSSQTDDFGSLLSWCDELRCERQVTAVPLVRDSRLKQSREELLEGIGSKHRSVPGGRRQPAQAGIDLVRR